MSASPANASPTVSPLARPLRTLRGVGPEREVQLARLGLFTVEDLLLHKPRRHEDRRHFRTIKELQADEPATTRGTIVALGLKTFHRGQKSVFEIIIEDGTSRLHCRWWNLPFMQNYFANGDEVFVFGKLKAAKKAPSTSTASRQCIRSPKACRNAGFARSSGARSRNSKRTSPSHGPSCS
jgi:RecG-like helicase